MQSRAWAITWRKWLLLAAFATTTGVYSLPAQTPQEVEIARAARQFRRQVYLNYHADRVEFDRRRAAAAQADEAFREAGGSPEDAERLRTWLLAAATASERGSTLPPTPEFGSPKRVVDVLPVPSPASSEPFGPPPDAAPHFTADADSVTTLDVPAVTPEAEDAVESAVDSNPALPLAEPATVDEQSLASEHEAAVDVPAHEVADADAGETPFTSDAHDLEPGPVAQEPATAPVSVGEAESIPETPEIPFETAPPDHSGVVESLAPETTDVPVSPRASGVNLSELAARISGHNFAVHGTLLDWGHSVQADDVGKLAEAVEQTASLAQRYSLLQTYLGLLSPAEHAHIGELERLDRVFTVLADAIAEMRERIEASDMPDEQRRQEVERLNELSRRLAQAFAVYDAHSESQP